jgi:hypothetical protein
MAVLTDESVYVSDIPQPSPRHGGDLASYAGARWLLAGCSLGAAVIHFGYAPAHFNEYWLYGLFFVVVAWLQVLWAVAIVARPSRPLLIAGAIGSEVVVAVWVASRTMGVLIGPGAGTKEAIGFPDVLCTVLEVAVTAGALLLLARSRSTPRERVGRRLSAGVVGGALLVVAILSGYALTPRFAAAHSHSHGSGSSGEAAPHTHGSTAALTGNTPCEKSGPPASQGQVLDSQGHSHRGASAQDPVDQATRAQLEAQQVQARAVAAKYPTVADAERGGYRMSVVYVPCIGAHYTNIPLAARFDPSAPSELLYDGTAPTSRIVGLSYLVYHPNGAPEGFAGPNDRWHQHNFNGGLCFNAFGQVVGSEDMTPAQCAAQGGKKVLLVDTWMLHDWVVPGFECSWGVFAPECPELGGRVGGTAWDAPAPGQQLGG